MYLLIVSGTIALLIHMFQSCKFIVKLHSFASVYGLPSGRGVICSLPISNKELKLNKTALNPLTCFYQQNKLYEVGGHLFEVCHHDNFMSRVIVLSVFQSTRMITSTELLAWLQSKQRNNLACLFCIVDLSVLLNRCVI